MTIDEIKQLLELFQASGVGEMEVQRGENRLSLKRNQTPLITTASLPVPPVAAAVSSPAPAPAAAPPAEAPADDAGQVLVKSPIVGTYYESPAPNAPAFVKVGDTVEQGQVLCIIESMKLMNEIEAEVAGTIVAKLVENGRPVEYGEALFAVRPR